MAMGTVGYTASSPTFPVGTNYNPSTGATPIGPSRPGYVQGTANTVKQPGSVLGASTSSFIGPPGPPPGYRAPSASQPQQSQSNFNNALQPTPGFQMPDYQSVIQPALDALNGAIAPAQSAFQAANQQIDANSQQAKNDALNQQQQALATANTQQSGIQNTADTQVNQQRQGASDTVRGLQAQFGGTTSAGSYLGEQAYRGSLQNISQIHAGLDNALQQINNQVSNVNNVTASTIKDIDAQTSAQKSAAQTQLDQALQQIRMAQGQLQSQKAELTAQALQNYQSLINQVNAQNAQYKQNVALEAQKTQQLLTLYGSRVTAVKQQLQSVTLGTDVNGAKTLGSFNPATGGYFDQNGQPLSQGTTATQATFNTPNTQDQNLSPDNIQRINGLFK